MTLSIRTLSITALSIMDLVVILSIKDIQYHDTQQNIMCCYAQHHNAVMLSVIMLSVVMLIVVAPNSRASVIKIYIFLFDHTDNKLECLTLPINVSLI